MRNSAALRSYLRLAVAFACSLWLVANPAGAPAKEPPNQHDPCSAAGRNTCGTTGVGFYTTYRYGLRWFGDYRGAVPASTPNSAHTFCIDLQYWYPSPAYRFREDTSGTLRNRDGETVSVESRRRIAYAIWAFGRSNDESRQAAVMLYVHSLMGDARPGEVDPAAIGRGVASIYDRVARDSARFHGPYRVVVQMPARLRVGEAGTATVRVVAASGQAMPGIELTLKAEGARVPGTVTTDAAGTARLEVTATTAADLKLEARSEPLPSTLPTVFRPTTRAAAPNGQRLVVPDSQVVTGSGTTSVSKAKIQVSSVATPSTVVAGGESRDRVTIKGASASFKVTVDAKLHGPFRTQGAIRCDQQPAWEGTWRTNGSGDVTTPAVKLDKPGWYVYQHVVPDDEGHVGGTTPCTDAKERVKVVAQPRVHTIVSEQRAAPGAEIYDRVIVEGLAGEHATVQAALYGPFANRAAIACTGAPAWSGTVEAQGDGEYRTAPFKVNVPGYYTYRESIAASELVLAAQTGCGDDAETTIVPGTPQVRTRVSAQQTRPGATITDTLVVTGLGKLAATIKVELFGPFATAGGLSCSGTPHWTATIAANGDGTYRTQPATIDRVGYYVYRESLAEAPEYAAFTGKCGETAETTVARAAPKVTTLVSDEVVRPGAAIHDRVRVTGLGKTEARIAVQLFGPFATRAAIRCTGTPHWQGSVVAQGDGTLRTSPVRLAKVGFYAYRERLTGSDLVATAETECGEVAETSLARPLILTGRADAAVRARAAATPEPMAPTRVRLAAQGIDAPVSPVVIGVADGALAVPGLIHRLGWWVDGMVPGSRSGAVLIAGHVDSAKAGPGAFFRLHEARSGDRVQVTTRSGRTFTYRVTSVRTMPKDELPTSIYSRSGPARLVLVTCGGPFDPSVGHYRDNIVVTAVPA